MSFEEYKTLGNAEFKAGSFEAAVDLYQKCIDIEGSNPVGYSNKAMALIRLEKYQEAIEICKRGLELETDLSTVRKKLQYRLDLAIDGLSKTSKGVEYDEKLVNMEITEVDRLPSELADL